jgi:hypothetical protein
VAAARSASAVACSAAPATRRLSSSILTAFALNADGEDCATRPVHPTCGSLVPVFARSCVSARPRQALILCNPVPANSRRGRRSADAGRLAMLRTRVNCRDLALFKGERAPTAKSQCMRVVTNASGGTVRPSRGPTLVSRQGAVRGCSTCCKMPIIGETTRPGPSSAGGWPALAL